MKTKIWTFPIVYDKDDNYRAYRLGMVVPIKNHNHRDRHYRIHEAFDNLLEEEKEYILERYNELQHGINKIYDIVSEVGEIEIEEFT